MIGEMVRGSGFAFGTAVFSIEDPDALEDFRAKDPLLGAGGGGRDSMIQLLSSFC